MQKIKEEIRILGIDDGPFDRRKRKTLVVGVIFRGGEFLDGLLSTKIEVDGKDSTKMLTEMVNKSKHKRQLKVIMLDGVTLGGFNVVDVRELFEKTKIPVIVINRKYPDLVSIKNALKKNFEDWDHRWRTILKAGEIKKMDLGNFSIFYQNVGIENEETEEIIMLTLKRAQIPEPLRIAHIIATGIVKGESEGHA
ncbi:MAG: DUF99 family protein [Candidatus Aenigmarchaeota archaeon]|nr:DUF99 family protein [Candidatus Aenigmarchaeota archaeon]